MVRPETWSTGHQWQGWPLGETRHIRYIGREFPGPLVKDSPSQLCQISSSDPVLLLSGEAAFCAGRGPGAPLPSHAREHHSCCSDRLSAAWSRISLHAPDMSILGPGSSWGLGAVTQNYTTPSDHCCPSLWLRVWPKHRE